MARRSHEVEILDRLTGVEGVPRLAVSVEIPHAIAMVDVGGTSLSDAPRRGPMAGPGLLRIAFRLAEILAAVHRRGVVHKDVNPSNILITPGADGEPVLIDFELATTSVEERPGFGHHREIVGTLAYIAPEQTGRTGRPLDRRADLYSLGATLYELAVGRPPFDDDDPLTLVHDHLARIPTPPAERRLEISPTFSAIVMRLLEKEPDHRYQSAEGLAHDLSRLIEAEARGDRTPFQLGGRDFPSRLTPPSRLFGRDAPVAALRTALGEAIEGRGRGVFVLGAPGVGKTAVVDELRPMVTGRRGWFAAGKYDQYRLDSSPGALVQALGALGRLLLAEPESDLVPQREALRRALGPNAGLIADLVPEFAVLLGPTPPATTVDPVEAAARLRLTVVELLRAVASPARPLVLVLDDLQWAGPSSMGFLDALLTDRGLPGLLLVGAYRDAEVEEVHPLSLMLSRLVRLDMAPARIRLLGLPTGELGSLLGEMLHLGRPRADRLAALIGGRTGGNPYDSVELVDALRQDGALALGPAGWSWDPATIRRFVGRGEVADLLAARIARLPGASRDLLGIMACLGGEVEASLLKAVGGPSPASLAERLRPALDDGLLVGVQSGPEVAGRESTYRFRHDRVQQAAYGGLLDPDARAGLHLVLARRLAALPGRRAEAAGQYLHAVGPTTDPAERRAAAGLFLEAASLARRSADDATAERYLVAATASTGEGSPDDPLGAAVEVELHAVLYALGRHEEADRVYDAIERRSRDPLEIVGSVHVQIDCLSTRGKQREALELGLRFVRRLGMPTAVRASGSRMDERLDELKRWIDDAARRDEALRPEPADPRVLGAALILNRLLPPAFFSDPTLFAELFFACHGLWIEHGPCAPLAACLGSTALVTIPSRQDYRTGYEAARFALAVAEARGYEPEASLVRHCFALFALHWFEPLENGLRHSELAYEGLIRGGDLQFACFTHYVDLAARLELDPTLEGCEAEVAKALAFALRAGNEHAHGAYLVYRQLLRALRGETDSLGGFEDADFDADAFLAGRGDNPMAAAYYHIHRALAAAVHDDAPALLRHSAAAMPLLPYIQGFYPTALAHLLRSLALAECVRSGPPLERGAALLELDAGLSWISLRAQDAPENFAHLRGLVEAERAWAVGDSWGAATAFDSALREAEARRRPWHRALIAERAARFHLAHGLHRSGRELLSRARGHYEAWGAAAKVRELERDHPFVRAAVAARPSPSSSGLTSSAIDVVAVLRASQALSSETDLERLEARIGDVLGAMTGATRVLLVIRDGASPGWRLSATSARSDAPVAVEEAGRRGLMPLSAFLYAERTREPLLVEDARRDDRFAQDPYLAGLEHCSLLVAPILDRGVLRAVLILENRHSRGVFSAERIGAVALLGGQLAISLDNASLYASLERRVAARTEELAAANRRLEALSVTDPLTGLANRRRFDEALGAEWLRAVRTGRPIAMAMVDVDRFKLYNDRYGHLAGDECLRSIASALRGSVRQGVDLVARYGGEEFAVILPGASLETAADVAGRACAAVLALNIRHETASLGIVTASVGVAAGAPSDGEFVEDCLGRADLALYEAKGRGRNQVACAPGRGARPGP
ncbi:diguanylate cyclase [Paludisphaera mucosa]|uniref:Diguanylate cyclase n=1 Tax=Paludisphaera mucosa TaxID=3030827 RepID=A0ABT6FCW5_9BACT|nr:diguanylate cyclase [Paludisphaera mucosa]MDG3005433.1 diguanylate cyclase [Paludisphaera mucosa]